MNVTTGTLASDELKFSPPIFSRDDGVLFSAYGLTFGYQAFTLSFEAACERLGAHNQERTQVLLAFHLNHPRIARAIKGKALLADGRRIVLDATDFIRT